MTEQPQRNAIFISHATPEDNAFVRWLGAKLTALGYEVWADILRLQGGADWSRELEGALRQRAAKVLLVCTPAGLDKQGVRNEIDIASRVAKQIGDHEFIIPLRIEPYDSPFLITHAQYIDFNGSWAQGFSELAERLNQFPALRREANRPTEDWLNAQRVGANRLLNKKELLTSNWLEIQEIPGTLYYCEPPTGFDLDRFQHRTMHEWPVVPYRAGVLTFATPTGDGKLSPHIPAKVLREILTEDFLSHGWEEFGIDWHVAQSMFADIANQAIDAALRAKKLANTTTSFGRTWWYGDIKTAPKSQVTFAWPQHKGRRQIIGVSAKRGVHWHYAISMRARTLPVRHVRVSASLIFSENGLDPIGDSKKAHRLRRSLAKSWRNARWRDMMLAFLWTIADQEDALQLPVANGRFIVLTLPPMSFICPVGVAHEGDDPLDEDDPDIDETDAEDNALLQDEAQS